VARLDGWVSGLRGKFPELEYDATKYLDKDYLVDNTKLKQTGYKLKYPGFTSSMKQLGEWYWNNV
jgi:hypothetical protein